MYVEKQIEMAQLRVVICSTRVVAFLRGVTLKHAKLTYITWVTQVGIYRLRKLCSRMSCFQRKGEDNGHTEPDIIELC